MMLEQLNGKLRFWYDDGKDESRQDLFEMLEAADAALKAQHYEAMKGMNL